jgi:hypothetical protein
LCVLSVCVCVSADLECASLAHALSSEPAWSGGKRAADWKGRSMQAGKDAAAETEAEVSCSNTHVNQGGQSQPHAIDGRALNSERPTATSNASPQLIRPAAQQQQVLLPKIRCLLRG